MAKLFTKAEIDRRKKLAKALAEANGEDIDDVTAEFYQEYIDKNYDVIVKGLDQLGKQRQSTHHQSHRG